MFLLGRSIPRGKGKGKGVRGTGLEVSDNPHALYLSPPANHPQNRPAVSTYQSPKINVMEHPCKPIMNENSIFLELLSFRCLYKFLDHFVRRHLQYY